MAAISSKHQVLMKAMYRSDLSSSNMTVDELVEYLLENSLISGVEASSIHQCTDSDQQLSKLCDILVGKGSSAFSNNRHHIRTFLTRQQRAEEHSTSHGGRDDDHSGDGGGRSKDTASGVDAEGGHHETQPGDKVGGSKDTPPQVATFAVLYYIFIMKLLHSYRTSSTVQRRLRWLLVDTDQDSISSFFPGEVVSEVHNVTDPSISLSFTALLQATQQLLLAVSTHDPHNSCHSHSRDHYSHLITRHNDEQDVTTPTANETIKQLERELAKSRRDVQESVKITELWEQQCAELQGEIAALKTQLMMVGTVAKGTSDTSSVEQGDDEHASVGVQDDTEVQTPSTRKQAMKEGSVSLSAYQQCIMDKEQTQQALAEMEREKTVWSQKHTTLSKEQELLVQTNKQLHAEIERLREEVEANKDYIEELKDRVANYKLNSNLKEPTAREFAHILESNRHLEKHVQELTSTNQCLQARNESLEQELHDVQVKMRTLSEVEEMTKKHTNNHQVGECLSHSTVVNHALSEHTSSKNHKMPTRLRTPTRPHGSTGGLHPAAMGDSVFGMMERQCPVCEHVFYTLSDREFTAHVAGCFK